TGPGESATATGPLVGPSAVASASGSAAAPGCWWVTTPVRPAPRSTATWAGARRWTRGDAANQAPAPRAWANPAVRPATPEVSQRPTRNRGMTVSPPRKNDPRQPVTSVLSRHLAADTDLGTA